LIPTIIQILETFASEQPVEYLLSTCQISLLVPFQFLQVCLLSLLHVRLYLVHGVYYAVGILSNHLMCHVFVTILHTRGLISSLVSLVRFHGCLRNYVNRYLRRSSLQNSRLALYPRISRPTASRHTSALSPFHDEGVLPFCSGRLFLPFPACACYPCSSK
jgi:hypothetical protein